MKKGNIILDMGLWFLLIVSIAIVLLYGNQIGSSINAAIQLDDSMAPEAKAEAQNVTDNYSSNGDNLFVFALILAWIFVFVASFLIDSHPLFFALSLILLVFIFIFGAVMSNFFGAMASDAAMATYAADFPKMLWLMDHLLEIGIAVAFTTMVGIYGKNQVG